jgi:hypothetical protein
MSKLKENEYIIILFKVHYTQDDTNNGGTITDYHATFDKINKVIKEDKDNYIETLCNILDIKDNRYRSNTVNKIIIEY